MQEKQKKKKQHNIQRTQTLRCFLCDHIRSRKTLKKQKNNKHNKETIRDHEIVSLEVKTLWKSYVLERQFSKRIWRGTKRIQYSEERHRWERALANAHTGHNSTVFSHLLGYYLLSCPPIWKPLSAVGELVAFASIGMQVCLRHRAIWRPNLSTTTIITLVWMVKISNCLNGIKCLTYVLFFFFFTIPGNFCRPMPRHYIID